MRWKEIRPSEHFELHHKGMIAWTDIVRIIYSIKNKRKIGGKIQIEDDRVYRESRTERDSLWDGEYPAL